MISKNKRAVFIDRDGTINPDSGYISNPEDYNIYPYTAKAIKLLNEYNYYTFIVTNQSGIARGYFNWNDLEKIHAKMIKQLDEEEAYIDRIFIAPYYKDGIVKPYDTDSIDRKPGLGLFFKAEKGYKFDTKKSFMIGDRYSDIVFGRKAGLKTILVLSGEGKQEYLMNRNYRDTKPHYVTNNLLTAVQLITSGLFDL